MQEHEKTPISQIIIIGDAPPNTTADTDVKLATWAPSMSRFPKGLYYDDQIRLVRDADITVHTFYVPTKTDSEWRNDFMAMASGPDSKQFDLDVMQPEANEHLAAAVTTRILDAYGGGGEQSKKLIETYVDKYGGYGYV